MLFKSNHYNVYLQCDLGAEDPMQVKMQPLMAKVEPSLLQSEAVCTPHYHVLTDREMLFKSNHYNVYLQCDPFHDLMAQQELQVALAPFKDVTVLVDRDNLEIDELLKILMQ